MANDSVNFTGRQIAAARALVGLRQEELAEAANISAPTLRRMELTDGVPGGMKNNLLAIQRALEAAGVVFVKDGAKVGGGLGVRLLRAAETHAELTEKIDKMEASLPSVDHHAEPSPRKAMKQLERAHGKNEIVKARGRRARMKKDKK